MTDTMRNDEGFTLVEILVVIIIIGILAAIAVPIFLNQQRTARDSATISDVRNSAAAVETALAQLPGATGVAFYFGANDPDDTEVAVRAYKGSAQAVSDITSYVYFTKTKGTVLSVYGVDSKGKPTLYPNPDLQPGSYRIIGYNRDGSSYTDATTAIRYYSGHGGIRTDDTWR